MPVATTRKPAGGPTAGRRGRAGTGRSGRGIARVLLLVVTCCSAALVAGAVLLTNGHAPSDAPSGPAATTAPAGPNPGGGAGSRAAVTTPATARGSAAGYEATVVVTPVPRGTDIVEVFGVQLTTEATPASAPSAHATLRGAGVNRPVRLTLAGAGRWTSDPMAVGPGRYTLVTTFERLGRPVVIPVQVTIE